MEKRVLSSGFSAAAAKEYRARVTAFLQQSAPNWEKLSNDELSKLLISGRITTVTGKLFSPERVREFRRARDAASESHPLWSSTIDSAVLADDIRRNLLATITELREPVSKERHAQLSDLVAQCSIWLLLDDLAGMALLWKAVDVAERSLARARVTGP